MNDASKSRLLLRPFAETLFVEAVRAPDHLCDGAIIVIVPRKKVAVQLRMGLLTAAQHFDQFLEIE